MPRGSSGRKATSSAFRCGDWSVDPDLNRISRDGEDINLEPRVMDLLVVLARYAPRLVRKQELIDAVWDSGYVAENTLTHAVSQLRGALGDDPKSPEYVETIHRRGYRLAKPISRPSPESAETAAEMPSPPYRILMRGLSIGLHQGENLIGRSPDATVTIDSLCVSRRHAIIFLDGREAVLMDLGSKNGTLLNGRRVSDRSALEHGDQILLGDHSAVLRFAESNETETPSEPLGLQVSTEP